MLNIEVSFPAMDYVASAAGALGTGNAEEDIMGIESYIHDNYRLHTIRSETKYFHTLS
jgi:hypothetical protein